MTSDPSRIRSHDARIYRPFHRSLVQVQSILELHSDPNRPLLRSLSVCNTSTMLSTLTGFSIIRDTHALGTLMEVESFGKRENLKNISRLSASHQKGGRSAVLARKIHVIATYMCKSRAAACQHFARAKMGNIKFLTENES